MSDLENDRIDRNDDLFFRHPRERHSGVDVTKEFGQSIPFFFTRDGAPIDLIGQYKGSSAFMICNGPSFSQLNHALLKKPGIMTLGVNNGPKTFRPDFWTCVDDPPRFMKSIWLDPKIMKFVPQAHFEKPIFDNEKWELMNKKVGSCPNVVGFRRNEHFIADRFLKETTINWGNHKDYGGSRSVMLPSLRILYLLGFRTVYLLGCDLNMTAENTYHFDEQRDKGAVNGNLSTYKRLIEEYFPQLKPHFDAAGFKVYNCNRESSLKVFPFISFDEAITNATKGLGDIEHERTWGLYTKLEDRAKWKIEPNEEEKKKMAIQTEINIQKKEKEKREKLERLEREKKEKMEQPVSVSPSISPSIIPPVHKNVIPPQPIMPQTVIQPDLTRIDIVTTSTTTPMPPPTKQNNQTKLCCMAVVNPDGTVVMPNNHPK